MTRNFSPSHLMLFAIGAVLFAIVMLGDPAGIRVYTVEDSLVEQLTALFYLGGAIACAVALMRGQNRLFALLWLGLCILFLGEETSWFQRMFSYSVPSIEAVNAQSEFNLHNLNIWGTGRFVDESGQLTFSLGHLLNSQTVFRMGFFTYFLALPLIVMWAPVGKFADRFGYPRMSAGFIVAIWAVVLPSFALALITVPPVKDSIAEVREMFYAVVIMLHAISLAAVQYRVRARIAQIAAE